MNRFKTTDGCIFLTEEYAQAMLDGAITDFKSLPLGLYEITWKSGGTSQAAVGQLSDGSPWMAPINWCGGMGTSNWGEVLYVRKLKVVPETKSHKTEPCSCGRGNIEFKYKKGKWVSLHWRYSEHHYTVTFPCCKKCEKEQVQKYDRIWEQIK